MRTLWQETSSRIGLLFVALGVLLAAADDRGLEAHLRPTSNSVD